MAALSVRAIRLSRPALAMQPTLIHRRGMAGGVEFAASKVKKNKFVEVCCQCLAGAAD